jgi:hypothetical protein
MNSQLSSISMLKKSIVLILICLGSLLTAAYAKTKELFVEDFEKINLIMSDLLALDSYLNDHAHVDYHALLVHEQFKHLQLNTHQGLLFGVQNPPFGVPSFLWGCAFGVLGVALVYFITEDDYEVRKAVWGCIFTNVLVPVTVLVVYWTMFFSLSFTI